MDKITLRVGDFIDFCTNPRLTDRHDYGFIFKIKSSEDYNIQIIQMAYSETLITDKKYLFNNPEEYITSHIRASDIRKKII